MADTSIQKGVLKTWKDDRGFGFIEPDNGEKDVFVHISSLKGMSRRPARGDVIFYEVARDNGGKLKAVNARIDGVAYQEKTARPGKLWLWLLAAVLGLISAAVAAYLL